MIRYAKRFLRWLLLLLVALLLFVGGSDHVYPISLRPLERTSRVVTGADGSWIYAQTNPEQKWRFRADLSRIDPLYLSMLFAFEDRRFSYHFGVDPLAVLRAAGQGIVRGHVRSGASTITMQLARLLEPKPRTLRSKVIETIRALQIEMHHSKDWILSAYLTLTPYGGNIEGVVAASMRYFGKRPENLSAAEAALLVALPKNPERYRPDRHPAASRRARNRVLSVAYDQGIITQKIYQKACEDPLPNQRFAFPRHAAHAAGHLLRDRKQMDQKIIPTTLHAELQTQLESWARIKGEHLPQGATLALLLVRNRDGAILAYLGSHDMFSRRTSGYVDMVQVSRSPGSTLKPFLYGMAFEKHILHPNSILHDRQTRFGDYIPHNYLRRYTGEVTAAYALQHSLNIPAVSVLNSIGPGVFVSRLGRVIGKIRIPKKEATLPVILGGLGVRMWQLAQLYTDLANGGAAPAIHLRQSADQVSAHVTHLLRPEAARKVTAILRTIEAPRGWLDPQDQIAYKTGTSYGYRDLWTAAYTRDLTLLLWVGRPDNAPLPKQSGLQTAAPLAFDAMGIAQALLPTRGWAWSPDYFGKQVPVGLRYFDRDIARSAKPLAFIRPMAHGRFRSAGCHEVTVSTQVTDGVPPYYGYLDGAPFSLISGAAKLRVGSGAHTLTVIDKEGETITRQIWVDQPDCGAGAE